MSEFAPVEPRAERLVRKALKEMTGQDVPEPIVAAAMQVPIPPTFTERPTFRTETEFKAAMGALEAVKTAAQDMIDALRGLNGVKALLGLDEAGQGRAEGEGSEVVNVILSVGVVEAAAIAASALKFQAEQRREDLLSEIEALLPDRWSRAPDFKHPGGLPPGDLWAEVVARQIAAYHVEVLRRHPDPSFGGGKGQASNRFSRAVAAIFMALGITVKAEGPAKRACSWTLKAFPNLPN